MAAKLRHLIRCNEKRFVLLGTSVFSLILAIVAFILLKNVTSALITQSAAETWRGDSEMRFSQVTAFLPQDAPLDEAGVYTLRQALTKSFEDQSVTAPEGGSLLHDAFCGFGTVAVSSSQTSLSTVKVLGVGGDWFFFHPLKLISGSYIRESDFMQDRVVLDEDLAWTLFGSFDVAGQYVQIGTREYPVAGVIAREDDFASRAAENGIGLFMSYEELYKLTKPPIVSYEAVMPNLVTNYAKNLLTEQLSNDAAEIVENTNRFTAGRLFDVLGSLARRAMNTKGIVYPYWENAARYCEGIAAILLLAFLLLLITPIVMTILQFFHFGKKYLREGVAKLKAAVSTRIEDHKKKNYTREGI